MQNNEIIIPILNPQIEQLPLYITQICVQFRQNNLVERADGFEDYQLAICLSGSGIFSCGGENYEINEHDAFLFSPGVPHSYQPTEQSPWVLDWVCYKGDLFDSLFSDGFCILRDIKPSKIGSEIGQIYSLLKKNSMLNYFEASKQLYSLLTELTAHKNGFYREVPSIVKLEPVTAYMERNFTNDISLEDLAAEINVSVSYLCRIFKSAYHMPPLQYLIRLRINHAKQLMVSYNKMSVREISLKCGYKDVSYFSAEFKRITGFTPAEYRRQVMF